MKAPPAFLVLAQPPDLSANIGLLGSVVASHNVDVVHGQAVEVGTQHLVWLRPYDPLRDMCLIMIGR